MSKSVSESGHAKNVANLGVMNSGIAVIGTSYKPSNPNIAADFLVTKKATCELAMKGVTSSNVIYQNAVTARNDEYHKMGVLTTRINNAFGACGATNAAEKNMASLKSKAVSYTHLTLPTILRV